MTEASFWTDLGWGATAAGTAFSIANAYYQADAQKYNLKAQAAAFDHQEFLSNLNARQAENEAQFIEEAGQTEKARLTLQQGQQRAGLLAGQGASGTAIGGAGSNAELRASQRLIQRLDAMTLDVNTLRAAEAARTQAVNSRNEALMASVSARNLRGTAGSISPALAAGGAALAGAGGLASQWVYMNRYRGGRS